MIDATDDDDLNDIQPAVVDEMLQITALPNDQSDPCSSGSRGSRQPQKRARTAAEDPSNVAEQRAALLQAAVDRLNRPAATPQSDAVDDYLKRLGNVLRELPHGVKRERLFHSLMTKALNTVFDTTEFGID